MRVPWYLMAKGKGGVGYKTASGPIVSVNDALAAPLRSLLVGIDPVQDLHGYDNPWPAGGGKQKIPYPYKVSAGSYSSNGIDYTINTDGTITFTNNATAPRSVYIWLYGSLSDPIPNWFKPNTQYSISCGNGSFVPGSPRMQVILYGSPNVAYTESSFASPADLSGYTGFSIVVQIAPGTTITAGTKIYPQLELGPTATAFAPYSNICPISGWSAVNVWRTGKNLLDVGNASGWEVPSGGEIAVSNNAVSIKILGSGGTKYWRSQNITLTGNVTISQKATCNNSRIYIRLRKLDDSGWMTNSDATITGMSYNSYYGGWYTNAGASTTFVKSITIPMCLYWNYGTGFDNASATAGDTETVSDIQLELGSTATPYEPYSGNQYTIQLGQTIYGATLDVINGALVVDRVKVDLGTLTWTHYGSGETAFFYSDSNIGVKPSTTNAVSSMFRFGSVTTTNTTNNVFSITGNPYVRIRCLDYTDAATFATAMSGVQLVYELATPITIPLSDITISTLKGQNVVWADTGDVTVEYLSAGGANPDLMKLAVAFMGR